MLPSRVTVVAFLFFVAALPAIAQISILGVTPDMPAPAASPASAPPILGAVTGGAPTTAAPACGLSAAARAEVGRSLQQAGKRKALILRGSNLGIHENVRKLVARIAAAFAEDRDMRAFLEDYLARPYLTDHEEATRDLQAMGYEVQMLASSDKPADPAGFRQDALRALGQRDVSLVVFYGHGNTSSIQISGVRENSAPGMQEIRDMVTGEAAGGESISVDDIVQARQAVGLLDGLIMHSCQSSTDVYIAERKGEPTASWAKCVKPDGFLGAWATYAVYFHPDTRKLLDRYFCHEARRQAGERDLAGSGRAYVRSGDMLEKMALLAGLDDRASHRSHGGDLDSLKTDPNVLVHDESQIRAIDGIRTFIDFAYNMRFGSSTLASDLTTFIRERQQYLDRHGVELPAGSPRVSVNPTTDEINSVLAKFGALVVSQGFDAALPGLVDLKDVNLALDPSDPTRVRLRAAGSINTNSQVDETLELVRSIYGQRAVDATGRVPVVGEQLAPRVTDVMSALAQRIPKTLIDGSIDMEIRKVQGERGNKLEPRVYGYTVTVGETAGRAASGPAAPYQVHLSLDAATQLIRTTAVELLGKEELELKQTISPASWLPSATVYGYARLHEVGAITRIDAHTIELPLTWELRVNWGVFGNGYAYAVSRVRLNMTSGHGLSVRVRPTVQLEATSGWPVPGFVKRPVLRRLETMLNEKIAAVTREPISLAKIVPNSFTGQVSGAVSVRTVEVSPSVVSLYIDHKLDVPLPLGMP